jgi:hypothetical protein
MYAQGTSVAIRSILARIAQQLAEIVPLNTEGKCLETVAYYASARQQALDDCPIPGLRCWKGCCGIDTGLTEVAWNVATEITKVESARGA